jgi:chorismate-pyruvate lyase
MSLDFVPLELLLSTSDWLTSEDLTNNIILPSIKTALEISGLLTAALKAAYGKPVVVECIRQSEWAGAPGILGLRRDVLLKVDHAPVVPASTLMPAPVIDAHPWLAGLGTNALGETLENRVPHRRGPFEFTRVNAGAIFHPMVEMDGHTWARRYRFELESGDLLVMETFFPGVLERLNGEVQRTQI